MLGILIYVLCAVSFHLAFFHEGIGKPEHIKIPGFKISNLQERIVQFLFCKVSSKSQIDVTT